MTQETKKIPTSFIAKSGLLIAITGIAAQIQIPLPFTPIPITLQSLAVLFVAALLPLNHATITIFSYILLGAAGLPVFSGFKGGISALVGPTGGFIFGFIPAVIVASLIIRKTQKNAYSAILFHLVLYFFGCLWLKIQTNSSMTQAFLMAVAPFILGDLLKGIAFCYFFPKLHRALGL